MKAMYPIQSGTPLTHRFSSKWSPGRPASYRYDAVVCRQTVHGRTARPMQQFLTPPNQSDVSPWAHGVVASSIMGSAFRGRNQRQWKKRVGGWKEREPYEPRERKSRESRQPWRIWGDRHCHNSAASANYASDHPPQRPRPAAAHHAIPAAPLRRWPSHSRAQSPPLEPLSLSNQNKTGMWLACNPWTTFFSTPSIPRRVTFRGVGAVTSM